MSTMMKGTDIPITLTNLPEGCDIKRLDFAQNNGIVITKYGEDFTIDTEARTATATLSQEETLKFDYNRIVDIQLSYHLNGLAQRSSIKTVNAGRILYDGVI